MVGFVVNHIGSFELFPTIDNGVLKSVLPTGRVRFFFCRFKTSRFNVRRPVKQSGQKDHGRLRGTRYRVCPVLTTKYGLILMVVF